MMSGGGSQSGFSTAAAAAMIDKDLVASGISDKDLEIEHLQTQLVALTEKSEVVEDLKKDILSLRSLLDESETKREEVLVKLAQARDTIRQNSQE